MRSARWVLVLVSLCFASQGCDMRIRGLHNHSVSATSPTPGPPYRLVFSGPSTTAANNCTALTITLQDSDGAVTTSGSSTNITLGGVGTNAHFYTTSACSSTTTSASIAAGQSSTTVYFADAYVEPTLTLTASGLTADASQSMDVTGPFRLPVDISNAVSGIAAGTWIAAADFDNDGNLDVAVSDYSGNRIFIAYGSGSGSFGSATTISINGPGQIAAASLRGDSRKDLIIPRFNQAAASSNLSVILGNGNRTFNAAVSYNSSGSKNYASYVEVAPNLLNNSAKMDVIVSYRGDSAASYTGAGVDVFPGAGDGTFGAPTGYAQNGIPGGIPAVGDLDGDGKNDFIIPLFQGGNANGMWYRNTGAGFTTSSIWPGGGFYANVYAFGNFNGDGFLDWALALSWYGAYADTNTNGTGGTNLVETLSGTDMASTSYTRARTGIFTASGNTDILFAQSNNGGVLNGVLFYPGNGNGTFKKGVLYHLSAVMADFVTGDFNGDGKQDVVALTGDGVLHFMAGR